MSRKSQRRGSNRRGMTLPIVLVLVGGLVLVGAAAALFAAGRSGQQTNIEVTGQPRLKVDNQQVDLGDIRLGRTVAASFVLTNVGDMPLRFSEPPYIEVLEGC